MKVGALIALVAFAMTLFAPFQISLHTDTDGTTASLFTLDVCHASGSALSVQADIPFLYECPCKIFVSEDSRVYADSDNALSPFLLILKQERPPKV